MNYRAKIAEVSMDRWGGMKYSTLKDELIKLYGLLDFFFRKTADNYLDQNERTVLSDLKKDSPPKEFLKELLELEKSDKNRKKVINWISKRI